MFLDGRLHLGRSARQFRTGPAEETNKKPKVENPWQCFQHRTCPPDVCSHACLLGEEIWIRQQDQPYPFPGAGGAGVRGFCSCRKEMGLWQGRLLRTSPHSTVQMLLLAASSQGRTQHFQELCALGTAPWAGEKWESEVSSHCCSQFAFASLTGTSLFKKFKILLLYKNRCFQSRVFC